MIRNDNVARRIEIGAKYVTQQGRTVIADRVHLGQKIRCTYEGSGAVAGCFHPSELKKGN